MGKLNKIILLLIFLIALFLRVYKLGEFPVGFLWDEAALGYNAYSILNTGRDEYGKLLPIIFKSFGDYKPGLFVYLAIPSIYVFGLNEFSVRFPSALFGSLTVLILYFLIKESMDDGLPRIEKRISTNFFPLLTALLLAVSPWHINFSRGAWELNIMLFELLLGIYFLLKMFNSKNQTRLGILSSLVFTLSLFTYQSAKLLVPVLITGFVFFYRNKIKSISKKSKIIFLSIFILGFFVFNFITLVGGMSGRLKVMSIFSYPRSVEETQMFQSQDNNNKLVFELFHSSPIFFTRSFLGRYFNYFSGKFLLFTGDWSNPRNGVAYQGVIYYADIFFLVIGLAILFSKKRSPFENFMLFWLIIAPVPAALTRDSISSVRSYTMVIPLVVIIGIGLIGLIGQTRTFFNKGKIILYGFIFFSYLFCFVRFLDLYFLHDKFVSSESRLYGYKQMIQFIKPQIVQKDKVVITNIYGQPYIFYLFYTQYDPRKYQLQAKLKENLYGDVGEIENIGNIEFKKIYWPENRGFSNSLFVGDAFELPSSDVVGQENITVLKEINFLNSKTALRIVETK